MRRLPTFVAIGLLFVAGLGVPGFWAFTLWPGSRSLARAGDRVLLAILGLIFAPLWVGGLLFSISMAPEMAPLVPGAVRDSVEGWIFMSVTASAVAFLVLRWAAMPSTGARTGPSAPPVD